MTRIAALFTLALTACTPPGKTPDSGHFGGDGADSGRPADTATDPSLGTRTVRATLRGTVGIEPAALVDGQQVPLSADEVDALSYPYGAVFIGVQQANDSRDLASTTVLFPHFEGNHFEVEVEVEAGEAVQIFAAVDDDANAIISSAEPVGLWPDAVAFEDGDIIEGLDLRVIVPFPAELTEGTPYTAEGLPCDVAIDGTVDHSTGTDGRGLVMLLDAEGMGPATWTWLTLDSSTPSYALAACPDLGEMQLVAAVDTNDNQLIDPMDTTGAHVRGPDDNGNPITVGTTDLSGLSIQMPILGPDGQPEDHSVSLVPIVHLDGSLVFDGGTFDDLEPGTRVTIAALKYRPSSSVPLADVETHAYDIDTFEWHQLQGRTSVDYALMVPGHTDVYLWAYADSDLDGTLNEVGEPVASAHNSATGYVATGSESQRFDMVMGIP